MKIYKLLCLLVVFVVLTLYSCKHNCADSYLEHIKISNYNGVDDTIITVKKYKAESNFSQFEDSALLHYPDEYTYVFNPYSEYLITVYPVGKVHRLKSIHKGSEKSASFATAGKSSDECHISITYTLDDSEIVYPSQLANSIATLTIKN